MLDLRQFDDDDDWEYTPKGISDGEFNENVDYLKSHPLFMKELPKEIEKNEHLVALQNLIYDDEPVKVAKHHNEKGKEHLAKGAHKYYYREAIKSFDEALGQEFEDNELKAKILSNRSLVNYKLKNYGRAIDDGKSAIKLDPKFIKPYFRCCQAYFTLEKYEDCIKMAEQGLEVEADCKELKKMKADSEKKIEQIKEKEAQKGQEKNSSLVKLVKACQERGITLGKRRVHNLPNAYERDPFVDTDGLLKFAVVVTYLEFGQMDFIQLATEEDLLSDHLREIFKERLPWDEKGYYNDKDLAVFVELNCVEPMYMSSYHTNFDRTFLRVARRKKFSEILQINGYVMPFVLELYVLSKSSPFFPRFLKEFDVTRTV